MAIRPTTAPARTDDGRSDPVVLASRCKPPDPIRNRSREIASNCNRTGSGASFDRCDPAFHIHLFDKGIFQTMNRTATVQRRFFGRIVLASAVLLSAAAVFVSPARAADEAPDALVKRISSDVLDTIKADKSIKSGDVDKIMLLVDSKIMPNVNFQRMTASAVGPAWRQATPEQQKRLQDEFKTLLVRTYAGALDQVSDQSVTVRPFRGAVTDKEVLVRTEIRGGGDPVQLDYRLEKTPGENGGWKVYNLNVLGVWLVDTYRTQFSQQINSQGIDGLISALAARNKSNGKS
jgi:phospholipid transport system substrate-binding protein